MVDVLISFRFNETYLLEPDDPMFVQIGNAFVEEYTKVPFNILGSSLLENVCFYQHHNTGHDEC